MFECAIAEDAGITWVAVSGRIDSMSSPEFQRQINDLMLGGKRILVINLAGVNYISSVGLRVFLTAQKQLSKAGGEILLYSIPDTILAVFKQSGFMGVFRSAATRQEIEGLLTPDTPSSAPLTAEREGVCLKYREQKAEPGLLVVIGSQEKLARAHYAEQDVVTVRAKDIQFGTGLASMGERYEEYKNFFGESLIINRHLFFYPAVKRPAVDFMLCTDDESDLEYKFLHGFGFNGSFRYLVSFEGTAGYIELPQLVASLFSISSANILGIVFLAESKGLWGMHLKKIPVMENGPDNGKEIFAPENFPEWANFPVEPGDINTIVAGCGIALRDREQERPDIQGLVAKGSDFHIHGGVFSPEPLSKNPEHFAQELTRVLTEHEVFKVQHILAQSRFSSGLLGIIEIKS